MDDVNKQEIQIHCKFCNTLLGNILEIQDPDNKPDYPSVFVIKDCPSCGKESFKTKVFNYKTYILPGPYGQLDSIDTTIENDCLINTLRVIK